MPALKSKLDTSSAEYKASQEKMRELVADLNDKIGQVAAGGGDKARKKHLDRDKLLPRDRIDALLDEGTPTLQ